MRNSQISSSKRPSQAVRDLPYKDLLIKVSEVREEMETLLPMFSEHPTQTTAKRLEFLSH